MGDIATNFDQQIITLDKRGIELDLPNEKIKEVLADIGYYRLGFYWNPFEKNQNHEFHDGTNISTVINLYYLDVDLRSLLLQYINRIEINFRTKVVYYASNKYKHSPTWFIDPKIMRNPFIEAIDDHYNDDFKRKNKPIKLHHQKYINDKYAPAWKTLEFFTFGAILKIFKSLKDDDIKERISGLYGVRNVNKFINLMETIVFIRNTCSHGGVLFDLNTPKGISKLPDLDFNHNDRNSLDSAIKVILYVLGNISKNRKIELKDKVDELFARYKHQENIKRIIEQEINYIFPTA